MKNTVKAWAVISPEETLNEWGDGTMHIYSRQARAQGGKKDAYGRKGKIVPCTITYEIPTPKEKN